MNLTLNKHDSHEVVDWKKVMIQLFLFMILPPVISLNVTILFWYQHEQYAEILNSYVFTYIVTVYQTISVNTMHFQGSTAKNSLNFAVHSTCTLSGPDFPEHIQKYEYPSADTDTFAHKLFHHYILE